MITKKNLLIILKKLILKEISWFQRITLETLFKKRTVIEKIKIDLKKKEDLEINLEEEIDLKIVTDNSLLFFSLIVSKTSYF